ncbi:MAG TPA: hypothetical protein PK718_07840 [Candidatus Methanofastidiosa archaeon]|nr:hypothetical protein [Candidatus Methanofastidiosa archaeon]HPR42434.1 hypothetical protein [Candidatus Methanofastidiosa archaeon]
MPFRDINGTVTRTYPSASIDPLGNYDSMFDFTFKQYKFKPILPVGSDAEDTLA